MAYFYNTVKYKSQWEYLECIRETITAQTSSFKIPKCSGWLSSLPERAVP